MNSPLVEWRRLARRRLVALLAIYAALFAVSIVGGAFRLEPPVPIRPVFLGNMMLLVGGAAGTLWLWVLAGGRGLLAAALVGGLAGLIEGVGQASGLLFGRYQYTGALTPVLPGDVPLAIVGAWVLVVVAALGTLPLLVRPAAGLVARAASGAGLVLALDLQIETVAANVQGYWVWLDGGPYYGVPVQNFLAWLLCGLLLCALTLALAGPLDPPRDDTLARATPLVLLVLLTALFTAINLAHGYHAPAAVGLVLLGLVGWRWLSARRASGGPSSAPPRPSDAGGRY